MSPRTTPDATATRTVTVASVPAAHVYVRHIAARHDDGVRRLADPDPRNPARSTEQTWWPPVMLDPAWLRDHEFDVLHVHFGFDAWAPERLAEIADAVHERGRRLIQTVHDLRNPHHRERSLHDAQLGVLLARADAVVTLTPGAAAEIERRWGRVATVLPHPHVVDVRTMQAVRESRARQHRRADRGFLVGLHLKSIRPSMDPMAVLPTLVEAVRDLPGGRLQVNGHRDVLHPQGARHDEALSRFLTRAHDRDELELHVHDYLSDEELWRYLASLDASVLPYRFGTHSGWLEACRDLGTAVIAPTCGFYAEQGPVHPYVMDEDRFDPESLVRAVRGAYAAGPVEPVSVESRCRQRDEIAAAHRALYLRGLTS